MLWTGTKGLDKLPLSFKLGVTAFLLVCGIGYLLGFANIVLTYSPVDGKPGLSVEDIRLAFYGNPGGSKLEKAVTGSMKQYLASEADGQKIVSWIRSGGGEEGFAQVQPIFASSCIGCHSADVATAGVVTESYKTVAPLLESDKGMPWTRLVTISHVHVNGFLPLMFCLAVVFSFTRFSNVIKGIVMVFAFASFTLDVAGWWFAKLWAGAAPLVVLGGVGLGIAYLVLIFLPLHELWLLSARRKRA